jgi:membrane protease YdiL (CAAX protease family)
MAAKQIDTKTLIGSLVTVICVEWSLRFVVSKGLFNTIIILGAARFLEIILISLILVITGQGLSLMGLAPSNIVRGLRKGLVWSAIFGIIVFLIFIVLYVAGVNALVFIKAPLPAKRFDIILFFFVGGMLGPIAEEVFFRGILYGFLRRWGVLFAVALSTMVFAVAHPMSQGVLVPQVVGGMVFAVAYEVEGSLLVPITIHVLGNMAIFTLGLIS